MLKRGPEIKLSSIKVPAFLRDLYADLRERHLLPLVALLAVAIVTIPIVFGGSSSNEAEAEVAAVEAEASTATAETAEASQLVAKAAPGLRRYQRRLDNLKATDPFKQRYTHLEGGSGGDGGGEGAEAVTIPEESGGGDTQPSYGGGESGSGTTTYRRTYYSYAIDVRVTNLKSGGAEGSSASGSSASGTDLSAAAVAGASSAEDDATASAAKPKPTVRRNLPEYTMLPSRSTPALVFVGATKDEKKALFVVSSDVESLFGDARCVLGSQRCQMIVMEPGLPETIVYGRGGRTFRIELIKVGLIESDKVNRAPLGKPKQGKQKE
ncbi:MAG: hypothetical protein R2725_15105 [Solirubrobacterales bacterium]